MPAHENLSTQFETLYDTVDVGASSPWHRVRAMAGEKQLGVMTWTSKRNSINVSVEPEHQRQGIATHLWNEGHRIAGENKEVPKPKHSADRTRAGDSWARKVGGSLPKQRG